MADREVYRGFIADSGRWDGFVHRQGDIVISAPSKSGTTWMQMLVALLVFDGPQLPAPLTELSPWLDMNLAPLEEVHQQLDAQDHRRFIKTHVPLDGLPLDDRVTYLVVGRDPRDVWLSMERHIDNLQREHMRQLRVAAVGDQDLAELDRLELPDDPSEWFRFQLEMDRGRNHTISHLAHVLHHLRTAWDRRDQPNVALFHYADLHDDLVREISRLAEILDIEMVEDRLAELADEASLSTMRARADDVAPESTRSLWKDPQRFFHSGRVGGWQTRLSTEDLRYYDRRVDELIDDDHKFARWVHLGWQTTGRWRTTS